VNNLQIGHDIFFPFSNYSHGDSSLKVSTTEHMPTDLRIMFSSVRSKVI